MKEQIDEQKIAEMRKDLIEIFDEEYEKRRLITADFTAIKMSAKGYRKQSEGEWVHGENDMAHCSECGNEMPEHSLSPYCSECGARMEGEEQ